MDKSELYDKMAERKIKPKDFLPYAGDNGRVNKAASLIKSGYLRSGGTLVDVGGAIGDLGYAVKDRFDKRIIVDISWKNLEAAAAKGNVTHISDVDREGMKDIHSGEATLVTALDFIEHIVDPGNFARECFRILKSEGEVFVNTPNIQYWEHVVKLVHGRFPHTSGDCEVYHGGHLAFYTYLDLCEIFGDAGFIKFEQVNDVEGFRQPPATFNATFMPAVKTQAEYVTFSMRFGSPNLLFKAVKP